MRGLAAAAVAGLVLALAPTPATADSGFARVEYVVDGDTVRLENGRYVRLIGIDTPEVGPDDCYAAEAAREARALVQGRTVLLKADPTLPGEPDADTTLREGAAVVTASGDKLLGGPQAGLVLGRSAEVQRLRRHPLARALRVDKLTLAALEASVRGPRTPVQEFVHADADALEARTRALADRLGLEMVASTGHVGGGGAPGVPLPGWAIALPAEAAALLRTGSPAVLARVHDGRCLIDLRCIPVASEDSLSAAIEAALCR